MSTNESSARALACCWPFLLGLAAAVHAGEFRFSGEGSDTPPEFSVGGPWTLSYGVRTNIPALASIEIRLHDRGNGDYLGKVAELKGPGSGYKLFEKPGRYQVVVVGTSVDWDITIEEISAERAATLKRQSQGQPSLRDTARRYSKRLPQDSFESWRPEGDDTLLLFKDGYLRWRVTFSAGACTGLTDATAVSFVTSPSDPNGAYDSLFLDDGTRCYFDNVVPGSVR